MLLLRAECRDGARSCAYQETLVVCHIHCGLCWIRQILFALNLQSSKQSACIVVATGGCQSEASPPVETTSYELKSKCVGLARAYCDLVEEQS